MACMKLVGNWRCQRPKGHPGRHGSIPSTLKEPDMVDTPSWGYHGVEVAPDAVAAFGARLIFSEVMEGGRGLVSSRRAYVGEPGHSDDIGRGFEGLLERVRSLRLSENSRDVVSFNDGNVFASGTPNGSYGYLYVTVWVTPS